MNSNYQEFEWFIELLGELELQQMNYTERFISFHLFMSSAKKVEEIHPLEYPDIDTTGIIQSRINDFVLKLNPGRPNFEKVIYFLFIYLNVILLYKKILQCLTLLNLRQNNYLTLILTLYCLKSRLKVFCPKKNRL